MKRKIMALTLSAVLGLGAAAPAAAAQDTPITRGEVVGVLLGAAPGLAEEDIIQGYGDGELKKDQPVTRAESFVMASRAFGQLAQPKGYIGRISLSGVTFSDVPAWAQEEVSNLARGGLLVGTEDGVLGAEEDVTRGQMETLVRRFYAYQGTNLKDDFYIAVNKQKMDAMELPEGQAAAGGSATVARETQQKLRGLIEETAAAQEYKQGTPQQRIRDFYETALDVSGQNEQGAAPLRPYLERIDAAQTPAALADAQAQIMLELGPSVNGLMPYAMMSSPADSSKKAITLGMSMAVLQKEDYEDPGSSALQTYRAFLVKQLTMLGETEAAAAQAAEAVIAMERELAGKQMTPEEMNGPDPQEKTKNLEYLDQLMPQLRPGAMFRKAGFPADAAVTVMDTKLLEAQAAYMTREHMPVLKTIMKLALLQGYKDALGEEAARMYDVFYASLYGGQAPQPVPAEEAAVKLVDDNLSDDLGKLYVARWFPPEAKAEAETLVNQLAAAFRRRVAELDWMSEETKQEALKKLDTLDVKIGYPDEWADSGIEIRGSAAGGTLFGNMAAVMRARFQKDIDGANGVRRDGGFPLAAYTVNAAANRTQNSIIFPAGILQAPFFDPNAPAEQNLGSFGVVIAHEITHVFDDQGALYDAQGNLRDWWTPEDKAHFASLCARAQAFYDGWEAAPGVAADGKQTLSENIADIGGMAAALEVLGEMESPDYDAFFRSYADSWIKVADRETIAELASYDEHAPNNLRVNRVLSNFQVFFDTYGIGDGDGMYVAPADRIQIW